MTHFVTKAPPINSINRMPYKETEKQDLFETSFHVNGFNSLGVDTHTHTRTYRLPGQKHTCWIQQLTQHTIALSLEWINPLCHRPPSTVLNNTQVLSN